MHRKESITLAFMCHLYRVISVGSLQPPTILCHPRPTIPPRQEGKAGVRQCGSEDAPVDPELRRPGVEFLSQQLLAL
jgi:hypothetical protein